MRNMLTFSSPPLIISMTLTTLLFIITTPVDGATTIDVTSLGATPNGKTDSSKAFLSAWNSACGSTGSSTIIVPKGQFLVKTALKFNGQSCKSSGVTFDIKGTIVGPSDFKALGNTETWFAFDGVTGVSISGGTFDAKGASLWSCKRSGNGCPSGATTLRFTNSMNIVINGVTSMNSQLYHIVIDGCKNVKVQGVRVSASGSSPNTDGIHVESSMGVTILSSNIGTGDDCVSIGEGTTNLWIEDMKCGPGHGISIGSLGKEVNEAGVQNVTVKTATFTGTDNGVRIKSWGRPSNGFVRNVLFEHITMVNAKNPIIIDQNYCPDNKGCPGKASGVKISGVTYQDIHGSSATPVAVKFDCSPTYPCKDIKLEDVKLTYNNQAAQSSCVNADGSTNGVIYPKEGTMEIITTLSLLIFFIFLPPTLTKGERYNIIDFGAKPSSETDSSNALLAAWRAACNVDTSSMVPPTIYVPQGRYLVGSALVFNGRNCKPMNSNKGIVLGIEGTLVAPADYLALGHVITWLSFEYVTGVTIYGGSLDGQGAGLWACKKAYVDKRNCPNGTTTLAFTNSKDITVSGLTSVNSQLYHIVINGCQNVRLQGLRVLASGTSPNTDGIHVQLSRNVMIFNSEIATGDDCVSVGAGMTGLSIENVVCGPGHGISIGSLGKGLDEPGVQNVTVTSVTITNTQNGVRIKSWARPSNGFVRNVLFHKITMNNVQNPIIIDQNYCPKNTGCPAQDSGIKISHVTYQDIQGTSATKVAVKFECSPKYPCTNIRMENIRLRYTGQLAAMSSCVNAGGTVAGIVEPVSCIIENN
ncbi:hypothetical protein Cgig2_021793 [Carnegiea gigantea]|uniref:Polygalacturonase n=1 Tax=Carnegiea gigantea TaxID=171969 RepID=A0A9Q1QF11_9CARY|nr:hypothetical protein Cgig2_021793 [Carnegiea gigantea]